MPSNDGAMRLRRIYEIGVYALVADVVLQLFLAGLLFFVSGTFIEWHRTYNALVMFVLCIALVIVGWRLKYDRLTVGMPAIIMGMEILQSILLIPYHDTSLPTAVRAISALHVVNGVAIFWVALQLMDRVRHPRDAVARAS